MLPTTRLGRVCIALAIGAVGLQRASIHSLPPDNNRGRIPWLRAGGYAYDQFLMPVILYLREGKLPGKFDSEQTAHPPLLTLLGGGFSRGLALLTPLDALEASRHVLWLVAIFFAGFAWIVFHLLRVAAPRAPDDTPALFCLFYAVILFNPRVFIQSLDFGNDLLANTLMLSALLAALRWLGEAERPRFSPWAAATGLALGAAALAKYTGLAFVPFVVVLVVGTLAWRLRAGEGRKALWKRRVVELLVCVALILVVAGWDYALNLKRYDRLMPSNYHRDREVKAWPGLDAMRQRLGQWTYEFDLPGYLYYSSRIGPARAPLHRQPIYRKLPTSLHALFWEDMGFYSRPGVSPYYFYPPKRIPPIVRVAPFVLSLFLLPLFLWGLWHAASRRDGAAVALALASLYIFAVWFHGLLVVGDPIGVKAKYILAVLPLHLALTLRGAWAVAFARGRVARWSIHFVLGALGLACLLFDVLFGLT